MKHFKTLLLIAIVTLGFNTMQAQQKIGHISTDLLISLMPETKALNAEIEMAAKALGLNYAYLPVVSGQITLEQAQEMARLLETMPGPILAFCRSGARSTNLYMLAQQVG